MPVRALTGSEHRIHDADVDRFRGDVTGETTYWINDLTVSLLQEHRQRFAEGILEASSPLVPELRAAGI